MIQIFKSIPTKVAGAASKVKAGIHKTVVAPFLPDFKVVFTMYNVIPGQPINTKVSTFNFAKGEQAQAQDFYNQLIASTKEFKVMPSEIQLVKRKKQIVKKEHFGPIKEIHSLIKPAK